MVPLIVTAVPVAPVVGERLVIPGVTVKFSAGPGTPATVTITGAAPRPRLGTVKTMVVLAQLAGVTLTPPIVTVLEPCDVPKSLPLMVTTVPTGPEAGDKLVIPGLKV